MEQLIFQDSGKTIHCAEFFFTSYKRAGFITEMGQKKIQNGRPKKFKMAASKKAHFSAPPIPNIFSWNSHGLVLGLVELIMVVRLSDISWKTACLRKCQMHQLYLQGPKQQNLGHCFGPVFLSCLLKVVSRQASWTCLSASSDMMLLWTNFFDWKYKSKI